MSLRVWLPLNGNLNNQGLCDVTVTNTNATIDNSGKIGKCYSFNGSDSRIYTSNISLDCSKLSISFWFYRENTTTASTEYVVSLNNGSGYSDCAIGLSIENSSLIFVGGGSCTLSTTYTGSTWHHVVVTFDNGTVVGYLDGRMIGTVSNGNVITKNVLTIGARANANSTSGGAGTAIAYPFTGKLNDFRLYDHALSKKEVKELSKALIIHYPMNDEYVESTTNINYFIEQGIANDCYNAVTGNYSYGTNTDIYKTTGYFKDKQCTKVYMGTADQEAFPYVFFKNIHPSNGSYKTLSFDYYPTSQNQINFYTYNGPANLTSTVNGTVIDAATMTVNLNEWNHITVTLYGTSDATNGWGYMKIGTTRHTSTTTDYWLFANVQIEEKDHATPYTDSSRNETIIYDCSGFTNNGTIKSNPVCSSNSPRYEKCYDFTNDKKILISNLPTSGLANSYTLSWWSNVASYSDRMCWGFANGNRLNYFNGYYCNTGDGSSNPFKIPNTTTTISQPSGDVWHHFAMVGNGTDVRLYMDGDLYGIATTYKPVTGSSIYINGWNSASDYNFNGKMSDFRIYSTALSAEDIKELYNSSAVIDNKGNVYAYEFKE